MVPRGWFGFKIVGDNIDKTVKPRHETLHLHSQNLHYFHAYAVRDRIDFSFLSAEPSQLDPLLFPAEMLLPSQDELDGIKGSFSILIARILARHLPEFADFQDAVVDHIPHKYSCEMEQKSNVVSRFSLNITFSPSTLHNGTHYACKRLGTKLECITLT